MSSKSFRAGVAGVSIPLDSTTSLPSLSTLVFTASGKTVTTHDENDVKRLLDSSATYQVIVGLLGRDATNKGYTMGVCSPSSGALTITSGQGIEVSVLNANWPAGISEAFALGLWLKTGAGDFKLTEYAYIDPSVDFTHVFMTKPLDGALTKTSTLLRSSSADDDLGDRDPKGYQFRTLSPTSGGTSVDRTVGSVEFRPDNTNNFSGSTTRSANISFELLANDVRDVVSANAGNYVKYTSGGVVHERAQMSLYTAAVQFLGNKPLKLLMPPDKNGYQEVRMYLGQNLQNQEGNTENWVKDDQVTIAYNFSAAPFDTLIDNVHTEVIYKRQA